MEREEIIDSIKSLFFIILFALINVFIPFLSIFVFFLWPLPVVYMYIKYGMKPTMRIIVIGA